MFTSVQEGGFAPEQKSAESQKGGFAPEEQNVYSFRPLGYPLRQERNVLNTSVRVNQFGVSLLVNGLRVVLLV
jgi:hypothetical protein